VICQADTDAITFYLEFTSTKGLAIQEKKKHMHTGFVAVIQ